MNNHDEILKKLKNENMEWGDFEYLLTLNENQMEPFYKFAQELTSKNFKNQLKIYVPGKQFPAISVTGTDCALHCEHCNKKYLRGMKKITDTEDLESFLINHFQKGGVGALISGGCDSNGSVPLKDFVKSIQKVKKKTKLVINTHTGLLDEETAKGLAKAKIDIISFDINMDEEIIRNIYHLEKDLDNYKEAVGILKKNNLNIVPHICVGLLYGKLNKEIESLRFIKEMKINPSLIVIIALIPPKSEKFVNPDANDIGKIIAITRFIFPKTEISLGCMRPRKKERIEIEKTAIKAGINRLEIPSKYTLRWVKKKFPNRIIKTFSACCAIPEKLEELAELKE
ncbi:MAG: radical SAM protein [Promethearchaeota archaeon]|nr:MAG: radical SAM protein [Candidatus Lokiarchaeota archaeon]